MTSIFRKQKRKDDIATLNVRELKVGHILAEDLVDASGVLLLPAGTALGQRAADIPAELLRFQQQFHICRFAAGVEMQL